jgi:hypothetical protein
MVRTIRDINEHLSKLSDLIPFSGQVKQEYAAYRRSYAEALVPAAQVTAAREHLEEHASLEREVTYKPFTDAYMTFKKSYTIVHLMECYKNFLAENEMWGIIRARPTQEDIGLLFNGSSYCPIVIIPSFDLKLQRGSTSSYNSTLILLYDSLKVFYEVLVSPDVDTEHLKTVIFSAIEEIGGRIPGISVTLNYLRSKSGLLADVIKDHYVDYLSAERSATSILSKFLNKAKDDGRTSQNAQVRAGIMKIISYFHQQVETQPGIKEKLAPIIKIVSSYLDDEAEEEEASSSISINVK